MSSYMFHPICERLVDSAPDFAAVTGWQDIMPPGYMDDEVLRQSMPLDERQMEVLARMAVGRRYEDVSQEMGVSLATAKRTGAIIIGELQASTLTSAVHMAYNTGLLGLTAELAAMSLDSSPVILPAAAKEELLKAAHGQRVAASARQRKSSSRTVNNHRGTVLTSLAARNITHAVSRAHRLRVIPTAIVDSVLAA